MHNKSADEYIEFASDDMKELENSRCHNFNPARPACFHAQQYVEKMIKARIIQLGRQFPRTHNLILLFENIEDVCLNPNRVFDICIELNEYEASSRYPGYDFASYTPELAEEAYNMAKEIPHLIGLE